MLSILYRVDGQADGQPIPQAQVTIIDFPPNSGGTVILSGAQPTGQTFVFGATVSPPTGTETLVIQAQAPGLGLSAQSQCSFQVVQPAGCTTACDCPTEQRCNMLGMCENGPVPVYCCEGAICPSMSSCQHLGGNMDTCP